MARRTHIPNGDHREGGAGGYSFTANATGLSFHTIVSDHVDTSTDLAYTLPGSVIVRPPAPELATNSIVEGNSPSGTHLDNGTVAANSTVVL